MPKISPVHWRRLCKIFEFDDWKLDRIQGDQRVYVKEDYARPVVIPMDREVQVFIILNNLKTAKISREYYFELLKKS